jgi:hypothetical protein
MFLTIFVKKSFFAKKNFDGIFFVQVTKKRKMTLPDESRDQIGKSQEIWDWLVHPPQSGG